MPAVRGTEPWVADLNEWRLDADLAVLTQSYRDVEPLLPESSMEADGEGFVIGGGNACSPLALFRANLLFINLALADGGHGGPVHGT